MSGKLFLYKDYNKELIMQIKNKINYVP